MSEGRRRRPSRRRRSRRSSGARLRLVVAVCGRPSSPSRMPSWVWYLGFFVVPVMVIVWYSFGYKPPVNSGQGPIATDHLSLQNYRDALSDTFFKTFQNTFRVAVIGTGLCLLIGFPVAYFIAVKVPRQVAGPDAGARDRAVLDELPHPHDRVADRARTRGVLLALAADDGAPTHADPLPRHAGGRAAGRRLQLLAPDDLPAVRRARSARRRAARGEQRPRREPAEDLHPGHLAARDARRHRRAAARVHPARR